MDSPKAYRVTYREPKEGQISELKVTKIEDSPLGLGFIALSGFLFEKSSILVDPEVESRMKQFESVQTLHLSMYSIVSIAELGHHMQPLSFENDKSNLVILPHQQKPPTV